MKLQFTPATETFETITSEPGLSLMQEGIGYAVMTETPVVIVDAQRAGPSTGQSKVTALRQVGVEVAEYPLQTVELVRRRLIHMREVTNGTENNQGIL